MNSDNAITVYDAEVQRPVDLKAGFQLLPVEKQKVVLSEYTERRDHFRKWLLSQLREGVHYGFPPGCEAKLNSKGQVEIYSKGKYIPLNPKQWTPKPSLYKAGALYLVDLLKLKATYESDLDAWKMMGEPKGTLVRTCKLLNPQSGEVLGEGTGTYEVGKKGMDSNSAIKMADKTAVVAAVINTLAISDLFTQDIEEKTAPSYISPDMDAELPEMVQKWVDTAISEKSPLHGHRVTVSELKALRANMSIWLKGRLPETPQAVVDWCKVNCRITEMVDVDGKPTGIKFVLDSSKSQKNAEPAPAEKQHAESIGAPTDFSALRTIMHGYRVKFDEAKKGRAFMAFLGQIRVKSVDEIKDSDLEFAIKQANKFAEGQQVKLG